MGEAEIEQVDKEERAEIELWMIQQFDEFKDTLDAMPLDIPQPVEGTPVIDAIAAYVVVRKMAMDGEGKFKKLKAVVDDAMKLYMIQQQIEKGMELAGYRVKVTTGTNSNISEKTVRDYLSRVWELDPDQIDEFLKAVIKKTQYDYVDMRKLEDKDA